MKKTIISMLLISGLAGFAQRANATAGLKLDDGINPVSITLDNVAPDAQPATGIIIVTTNIGVWNVVVTTETKPVVGSATSPVMDVAVMATSTGAGTLTVSFSDTGFGGKGKTATGVVTGNESGTISMGSATVDFKVYGDGGNALFAQTSLLADGGSQPWPPLIAPFPGSFALNLPFSLTEVIVVTVPGPAHLSIDASLVGTLDQGNVAGCRVTGGSNHETNNYQSACISTPPPDFVSHGGQVGAALSDETPFTPYDPCIGGSWEHNRHLVASGLVGTLHASGNGNVREFDSLLCACLPCPENPGAVGVVGNLCNPGDKVCGPLPRHAPANKICFSGVGDFTFTSGPKTVKAVFRVDIEDRSEGNSQSSTPPPDRYRIRIWLLDPSCGRDPNPDTAANMAIRYGASADPAKIIVLSTTEDLKDPTIGPPDIDDGGDMTQGNHQIHPSTGARCKSGGA
jgi:hypothetical protein